MIAKHVITSARVEGKRRDAETPRFKPPPPRTPQKSPREQVLGSWHVSPPATIPNKKKHTVKDPVYHSVPAQQMVTPSPDLGREGRQHHNRLFGSPNSPAVTRHQVSKLNFIASEEEATVAVMRDGARYQERLARREEGDGIQKKRHENARDVRDRVRKQRHAPRVPALREGGGESPGVAVERGVLPPESHSRWDAFHNNAVDASQTVGQVTTPSKSAGKRLASPPRQLGGQEQKKVRLSLGATEVNWRNKSIASGTTANPQAVSHGELPHQEVWSLQGILSPSRGRPHGHARKIAVGHDEDENSKDDSDQSTLDHSNPFRVSENKLPSKRVAAQSDMEGKRDLHKRARLSPRREGQLDLDYGRRKFDLMGSAVHDRADEPPTYPQSSATRDFASNVGPSIQPMSSESNHWVPKEHQRRSYLSAAWEVLRGLFGRNGHGIPRP